MSNDPDEIREQIELTRGTLSSDVNALAETVKPGNVARRQADKVRGAAIGVKDKVMGTASDLGSGGSSSARSAMSSVSDATSATPDKIRSQTQGNPLAAGVIAFGLGWLAASLAPASRAEQQAVTKVKDNAAPLKEHVTEVAKETAGNLKEPAQQAVESVKSTASEAAGNVHTEGQSATADVKDQAQDAKQNVQDTRN